MTQSMLAMTSHIARKMHINASRSRSRLSMPADVQLESGSRGFNSKERRDTGVNKEIDGMDNNWLFLER